MIQFQTVIDFLQEYGQIHIKGNKINMRCPLCGDSKKSKQKRRFWATWDESGKCATHCFNCGVSGTFAELVSELKGISIGEAINSIETVEFCNIKKILEPQILLENNKIDYGTEGYSDFNYILNDCISIDSEENGYFDKKYKKILIDFIKNRKIPSEYNVFVASKGEYKNRFIIPVYHWGDIVYFQGRAINDDMEQRFKNPEVEKSNIIMNIEYFDKNKYIIVTEGIIDAMMIEGHQGTCVLGGSVSDEFLYELYKHTDKGIIIAVDNDERGEKERNNLISNSKYGKLLKYFITPDNIKDLNKYKTEENITDMYNTVVSQSIDHWTLNIKNSM